MCKILFAVLPSKSPLVPAASQYFHVNEAVGHSLFVETWLLSPSLLAYRYQCKARGRLSGRAELSGFLIGQGVSEWRPKSNQMALHCRCRADAA